KPESNCVVDRDDGHTRRRAREQNVRAWPQPEDRERRAEPGDRDLDFLRRQQIARAARRRLDRAIHEPHPRNAAVEDLRGDNAAERPPSDGGDLNLRPQHDAMSRGAEPASELEILELRAAEMPLVEPASTLEGVAADRPARRPERRRLAGVALMEVVLRQIAILRD